MSDYIERQKAVEALDGKIIVTGHKNADAVLQYMKDISNKIKAMPSADVAPVVHSRWIETADGAECEKCGREAVYQIVDGRWKYEPWCPHCGAKMDEGDEHG